MAKQNLSQSLSPLTALLFSNFTLLMGWYDFVKLRKFHLVVAKAKIVMLPKRWFYRYPPMRKSRILQCNISNEQCVCWSFDNLGLWFHCVRHIVFIESFSCETSTLIMHNRKYFACCIIFCTSWPIISSKIFCRNTFSAIICYKRKYYESHYKKLFYYHLHRPTILYNHEQVEWTRISICNEMMRRWDMISKWE